jgi:hypothetical protein
VAGERRQGRAHARAHTRSRGPAGYRPPDPDRLKVELLVNAVGLGFLGLQTLLGALAAARFVAAARIA